MDRFYTSMPWFNNGLLPTSLLGYWPRQRATRGGRREAFQWSWRCILKTLERCSSTSYFWDCSILGKSVPWNGHHSFPIKYLNWRHVPRFHMISWSNHPKITWVRQQIQHKSSTSDSGSSRNIARHVGEWSTRSRCCWRWWSKLRFLCTLLSRPFRCFCPLVFFVEKTVDWDL